MRGGTRWASAATVVSSRRGFSKRGARAGEPRQRRHALRGDGGVGRDAVVGLAVPGREFEDFRVRRREDKRLAEGAQALAVARDMDQRAGAPLSGLGEAAREIGGDEGVETVRRARQDQRAAFFQFGAGAVKVMHGGVHSGGRELSAQTWIGPLWVWNALIVRKIGRS